MHYRAQLIALLEADAPRLTAMAAVRDLELPDCWIGAGFVRDAVWDHLHAVAARKPDADVDVIWFDSQCSDAARDCTLEAALAARMPELVWSVKNQARMHRRNGDAPYSSVANAMTHWPETATAVAVRIDWSGGIEVNAPLGLEDLFCLRLAPTPHFRGHKRPIFDRRVAQKRWFARYPDLIMT